MHPSSDDAPVLDTSILSEIATGLAYAIERVEDLPEQSIERMRLLSTQGYDAWLMVWGPGATLEAHDHDGSIGVMHVIRGELLETAVDGDPTQPDGPTSRRLEPGGTSEFPVEYRHSLFNPSSGTTVSIGVYSPPLGADLP